MRHSLLAFALLTAPTLAADPTPQQVEFFEKKIRPVLSEHCYSCHGAEAAAKKKLKGGLLLDTAAGLLAGGDSGQAIDKDKPLNSLLLKSLKYDGDVKMPPKGKLPDAVIADVEAWVKMGAPDPRGGAVATKPQGMSLDDGRKFWAYQPIPVSHDPKGSTSGQIDSLIRKKLEEAKLSPAPSADKAVLIRRLYFDLHGLPPTPEQIDAFMTSQDPTAYEKLVDELLSSPRFGERWARHWFDVSRYAESLTLRGFVLKEAWRYRDYVIDAFNADRPFDRFVKEQIAGDLLPHATPEERTRNVVATAFLAMGNNNLEEQDKKQLRMDVVDEMLDVIGKGLLAQTITCARCHDHKFDPIPTKDYYALAGILRNAKALEHANVSNWIEVPLPVDAEKEKELKAFEAKVAALQAKINAAKKATAGIAAKGVLAVAEVPGIVIDDARAKKVGAWKDSTHNGTYIGAGYTHDENTAKGEKSITFQTEVPANGKYEVRLAYSPGGNRANNVPVTVFSADGEKEISVDMTKNPPIDGRYISLGEFTFEKSGQSFVIVSNEGTQGHVCPDAVVFLSTEKKAEKPATADTKKGDKKPADDVKAMEDELKKMQAAGPKRPKALSVTEEAKIEDARIHIRGLVGNQGEVAPRGFLQVATVGKVPEMPKAQSGRKELAEWVASGSNPLTARVYVNRVWHWLLGRGLVRTPDNFGVTGELPTHPELLDFLAGEFVRNGWSTKKLVRAIVLSDTYRRSSAASPELTKADPENKLWGRSNRRRMEAEQIRDTLLSVSGQLKLDTVSGPTYPANVASDYGYKAKEPVRSVYLPVFRNSLPELFEVFDFADTSVVMGQRNSGTIAPQALYMLNNPFPIEQAKLSAARLLGEKLSENDRITRAYRLTLGREPTPGERQVMAKFLGNKPDADAWAAVFQAMFASGDFRYVD
ncbi:MAG: DUF1553 domain-containing protein [Fimbriiglobus sp.]|nr:DUF1553 domain-containing protein [Fimbriiglobus sp.]